MKAIFLKQLLMRALKIPGLVFLTLLLLSVFSFRAEAQIAIPNPVCDGYPFELHPDGCPGWDQDTIFQYHWYDPTYVFDENLLGNFFIPTATGIWTMAVNSPGYNLLKNSPLTPKQQRYYLDIIYRQDGETKSGGGSKNVTITEITITETVTDVTCYGDSDGAIDITVTVVGGIPIFGYNWSNGATTQDISGLAAGDYTVTVTEGGGCTSTKVITVDSPAQNTVTLVGKTDVTCYSGNNGSITVTGAGGTTPYSYYWSTGATTPGISNLIAGNYCVTVTDAHSCTATACYDITEPPGMVLDATVTDVTCPGGSDGAIDLTASGGTMPYTYYWSTGATTEDIDNLAAGNYGVTVTDAQGCSMTGSWPVEQPFPFDIQGTVTHVNCYNGDDGEIDITVNGGTPGYSYNWSNGAVTEDLSDLTAGTYYLTVTDSKSCTATYSATVTEPQSPVSAFGSVTHVACNGEYTGAIYLSVGGGTPPYDFYWMPFGQTTQNITNLGAGNYCVTVTDDNGCTVTGCWDVTQPPEELTVDATFNHITCYGDCDGFITSTPNGGTPPYSYYWSTGETTDAIYNLCPDTYSLTVTDDHGCTTSVINTITQPDLLNYNYSYHNVTCNGDCDGDLGVYPYGGTPPYYYYWNNGATTNTLDNLCADFYYVTITDDHGCTATFGYTISEPDALQLYPDVTNVACYGEFTGAINLSVSGGTTPYTFYWTPYGQTTQNIANLGAGQYCVEVTDAHGCTATGCYDVTQPPAELTVDATFNHVTCYGDCDGFVTTTTNGGTPPYTYYWSTGETTDAIYNLCPGPYSLTVTDDHGCTTSVINTITQPDMLSLNMSNTNVTCYNDCDGTINTTVGGGTMPYYYYWSDGNTDPNRTGLCADDYWLTVTDDHGCTITGMVSVTQPQELGMQENIVHVACYDEYTGAIYLSVYGGTPPYSYYWSPFGQTTSYIMNLHAGNYCVTVTDDHGCTITGCWDVTQPPAELTVDATYNHVTCYEDCDGYITTTTNGGTAPYTYYWSTGETTDAIYNLCPGPYSLTVTDAHGCTTSVINTITEPDLLTLNMSNTNVTCYNDCDGTINTTVGGGTMPYYYYWSDGNTDPNRTGLCADDYWLTVTDDHGCTITGMVSVTQPQELMMYEYVTHVACYGEYTGAIYLSVYGGTYPYTYYWGPYGQTTSYITNLGAGNYCVTVTDDHGCTITGCWDVTQPPAELTVDATYNHVTCYEDCDGYITTTTNGGTPPYTYYWSTGETTDAIYNLCPGPYSLTVTDDHGCTTSVINTITQPDMLTLQMSKTDVDCYGNCNGTISTTVGGGTMPYYYYWSDGSTDPNRTGLCADDYWLTVTDDHGCTVTGMMTITQPTDLMMQESITHVACYGEYTGAIYLSVWGGTMPYSYYWGPYGQTTSYITNLGAGNYCVTVTDDHGCTITGCWDVTQPPAELTVDATYNHITCYEDCDGYVTTTTNGGTPPYTYYWSTGETTDAIYNLCPGPYSLTVTDDHGCTTSVINTITQPDLLTLDMDATQVLCYGECTGEIMTTVAGGTMPYYYYWSDGNTDPNRTGLCADDYWLTVTDDHGCTVSGMVSITQPDALDINAYVTDVACYGEFTGAIDITVTGGVPPYSYYWTPYGQTTQNIANLGAGLYCVEVTDAHGCTVTGCWNVTEPAEELTVDATYNHITCYGDCDGFVTSTTNGGTPPYSYYWSTGETTDAIYNLCPGPYSLTVTDDHGCTTSVINTITQPDMLTLDATVTDVTCYGYDDGAIDLTVTGGTPAYNFLWNDGVTTEDRTGLAGGLYSVTVTDAHGCTIDDEWTITQPEPWGVLMCGPDTVCCETSTSNYVANYFAWVWGAYCEPVTYEWVVTGGEILFGHNTPFVTVKWDCCDVGTLTVVATSCDGCVQTWTKTVTIIPTPAPIITGPATVYAWQTGTTYCTPYYPGHLYTWTVVGGTVVAGQGTNCITVDWNGYPACGCGEVTVCETYLDCTGCTTMDIVILPGASTNLSGYVTYDNMFNTALNGVDVSLYDPNLGIIVGTVTTGPNLGSMGEPGYYAFDFVADGTYQLLGSFDGAWGGNNATDALIVQQYVAGTWPLTGLPLTCADVNASLSVTALDALMIKLRTIGLVTSYAAGDWKFEDPMVTVSGPTTMDFKGLCVGDVNGSYIPTSLKQESYLASVDGDIQTIPVNVPFQYELSSNTIAELGAMTLFMSYDESLFEVVDVLSANEEMEYVVEDGRIGIAWSNTLSLNVTSDEPIITLMLKAKDLVPTPTQIFTILPGSEFADANAKRFENFKLKLKSVSTEAREFTMFNYPNPFKNTTTIAYTLPEAGKVTLELTDMYGKPIKTLVSDIQESGAYSVEVDPFDLHMSPGVYMYNIKVEAETKTYVKVGKMILTR